MADNDVPEKYSPVSKTSLIDSLKSPKAFKLNETVLAARKVYSDSAQAAAVAQVNLQKALQKSDSTREKADTAERTALEAADGKLAALKAYEETANAVKVADKAAVDDLKHKLQKAEKAADAAEKAAKKSSDAAQAAKKQADVCIKAVDTATAHEQAAFVKIEKAVAKKREFIENLLEKAKKELKAAQKEFKIGQEMLSREDLTLKDFEYQISRTAESGQAELKKERSSYLKKIAKIKSGSAAYEKLIAKMCTEIELAEAALSDVKADAAELEIRKKGKEKKLRSPAQKKAHKTEIKDELAGVLTAVLVEAEKAKVNPAPATRGSIKTEEPNIVSKNEEKTTVAAPEAKKTDKKPEVKAAGKAAKPEAKKSAPAAKVQDSPDRNRLMRYYKEVAVDKLKKQFNFANVNEVPRLEKIVVNMRLGDIKEDAKKVAAAVEELKLIVGQKPIVTRAKKSVANFKLREGMNIGAKVTLRGKIMYEFFDKLVSIALPRVRDFKGISGNSFDGRGNYSLGIKEQLIFPEITYDQVEKIRGFDICIVTTAPNDEQAKALLVSLGMPFKA